MEAQKTEIIHSSEKRLILIKTMYQTLMKEAQPVPKTPNLLTPKTDIIRKCIQPAIRELYNPKALLVKTIIN